VAPPSSRGGPRPGAGRPALPLDQRARKRSLALSDDVWRRIDLLARRAGSTKPDLLERLVRQAPLDDDEELDADATAS